MRLFFAKLIYLIVLDDCCAPRPYHNDTNGTGIRWQVSRKLDGDPYLNLKWNQNVPGLFLYWHLGNIDGHTTLYNGE